MTTVRRQDFVASNRQRETPVAAVAADPALAGLDAARADLDGNGVIRGDREHDALFTRVDAFDRNGDRRSVAAPVGSRVHGLLNALQQHSRAVTETPASGPLPFGQAVAAAGERSIKEKTKGHSDAIAATGVGTHYGDHSTYAALSAADKQQFVKDNALPGTTPAMPKESSCIGWVYENVGAAYAAAGKGARWAEIQRSVVRAGSKGTDLARELQKDGWKAVYWNPDTKNPADGSAEHSFSASQVKKGKPYYGIKIDAQVTNYRPTLGAATTTTEDLSGLKKLADVPFFFGLARGGMHTFVGTRGEVNELHWADDPTSTGIIEQQPLKDFAWLSGVIMVPPGTW